MAIELATAYVSLVADTSQIGRQLNQEFGKANTLAAQAGGQMGTSMSAGMKKAFLAVGGVTAIAAGLKQVVSIGNDFTTSMNTMQAVSSATASQMQAVSQRAKELGNDISLPGTSANDAAAAMTELAKGGFTVEQAMSAAKGTLQLAAAAQIDAAQAATIQSQALQAFGLDASNAAMVADTLANAANASSAEITDVAYAFQASGAVANQFGLTVQETASAIGLLANAGIQGSDAGTLLKSALLALTDQSNPAQGAIEELGLTVYDAAGQFVGLESLFGQLQTAAQRMTPEMYQAATNVLFGSDAARLAGIAAEQGAVGFDTMEQAIGRQGAAAEVAAAKTQGLPGAMESVNNSVETLALGLYDLVDGPLESLATGTADFVSDNTPGLLRALGQIGSTVADLTGTVADLPTPILAAGAAFAGWKIFDGASRIRPVTDAFRGFGDEMRLQAALARSASSSYDGLGPAITGTQAPLSRLGQASAAASVGMDRLKTAGRGVLDMLGGPWVVGIAATATALITAKAAADNFSEAMERVVSAADDASSTLAAYKDAVAQGLGTEATNAAIDLVGQRLAFTNEIAGQGVSVWQRFGKALNDFTPGDPFGFTDKASAAVNLLDLADEKMTALSDSARAVGISMDDVNQVVAQGGSTYGELINALIQSGEAGQLMAGELQDVRNEITRAEQAAKNTTPGFYSLSEAMDTIADSASDADAKTRAFKTALDIMSGQPIDQIQALSAYNSVINDVVRSTREYGDALLAQSGFIDTTTEGGEALQQAILDIKDATVDAAVAGVPMEEISRRNAEAFASLAEQSQFSAQEIEALAAKYGLVPKNIETLIALEGDGDVAATLQTIKSMLDTNAEGVKIPIDALSEDAMRKLQGVEGMVVQVDESEGIVFVDAPNEEALRKLQEVIDKNIPPKTVTLQAETTAWDVALARALQPETKRISIVTDESTALYGGGLLPMPGLTPNAEGGSVVGGTPGKDSVPSLLMPGEHVLTTGDVSAMGGQAAVYDFRRALHMATGGAVPGGVSSAITAARGVDGNKYLWGGTGPTNFDCSGFIGWLQQIVMGSPSTRRLYTTYSLLGGSTAGLKSGLGPAGTWFQVGVNQEHMAGTLAGYAVESGGAHGTSGIGGGRASAQSSQFPAKFHLPNELVAGIAAVASGLSSSGSGGSGYRTGRAVEWTESDDLDLDKARLDVDDAKAKRDSVYNDPESSDIDKREADLHVREAEAKAVELQQKKDTAGMPTPEAPGLDRQYSDDEIEYQRKVLAVDEARQRRNEVYADIEATQSDRLQADLDLAAAENALAEVQTESASSDGGSIKDRVKKLGSDLVGIGVDAALEQLPFGLGSTHWLDVEVPDKLVDRIRGVPTSFPQEELDRQMPVTTGGDAEKLAPYSQGAPSWIQDWIKHAKVFDQGGWLEPGDIGINLGSRPEPIFNSPEQLAQFAGNVLAPATDDGPSMTFNITGPNPQQIAREVQAVLRMYQMRSGARVMATS